MMKKRMFAFLTALCCGASVMAMPVTAEESATSEAPKMGAWGKGIYLVCNVPSRNADGQASWLLVKQVKGESPVEECMAYWDLTKSDVVWRSTDVYDIGCNAKLPEKLAGQEIVEEGDLLCIDFSGMIAEVYPGCMHLEETDTVTNLGAAVEIGERKTLTITEENGFCYTMVDAEGATHYYYDNISNVLKDEETLLSTAKAGDQVEWIFYEDAPVMPLSVSACDDDTQEASLSSTDFIVTGVDNEENPQNYIVYSPALSHSFYLTPHMIAEYFIGDTMPAYGDVLSIEGDIGMEPLAATTHFTFLSDGAITVKDSVFGGAVYASYTVEGMNDFTATLSDENGRYYYYIDYTDSYLQPDGIDWSKVETGDEVTFLSYGGRPVLPVGAPSGTIDVIVSSSGEGGWFLTNYDLSLTASEIESVLTEGSAMPALGDVICYEAELFLPIFPGRVEFGDTGYVTNLGPVWEYYSGRSTLTVTAFRDNGNQYIYSLLDEEPEKSYQFDFVKQGSGWNYASGAESMRPGDVVTFVTDENGRPVYPLSVERLGDANADGALTIVDVVMVNRHVMGADMTSTTMNTDAADFDKNGEVTHEDSLSILKRLVGLV